MQVTDGVAACSVDGRELHKERIGKTVDPWLAVECNHLNTGFVRDFTITGTPVTPESIDLLAQQTLPGWQAHLGDIWLVRGEEMYGRGARPKLLDGQKERRSFPEAAVYYQRPMLEDGTVKFDFYYDTGKGGSLPDARPPRLRRRPGWRQTAPPDRRAAREECRPVRQPQRRAEIPQGRETAAQGARLEQRHADAEGGYGLAGGQRHRRLRRCPSADEPAALRLLPLHRPDRGPRSQRHLGGRLAEATPPADKLFETAPRPAQAATKGGE